MNNLQMREPPLSYGAAAIYPYSEALTRRFTAVSRFDEEFPLYRVFGPGDCQRIALPRNFCPIANDRRVDGREVSFVSSFKPRNDRQQDVVAQSSRLLIDGESHLLQAPTGFGKTACAMDIIARVQRRTLIIVPKDDVAAQWKTAAKQFLGLDNVPVVRGTHMPPPDAPLVIGMIQSLSKPGKYPASAWSDFGLVVWDEVHRVGADVFSNTAWMFPALRRLGLSATPTRKDGKEILLHAHIGPVRVKTEVMSLIPVVVRQRTNWKVPLVPQKRNGSMRLVPMRHEPGKCGHLVKRMAADRSRNLLLSAFVYKAYNAKRCTIIFSESLAHLSAVQATLVSVGISRSSIGWYVGLDNEAYHGTTEERRRQREVAKVKPIILATYAMASEATDIPWLDTAVLGSPRSDVVQIIGRILREHPDKKVPLVLDLVDDDSSVFAAYARKRLFWYHKIGAEVHNGG